MPDKLPWLLFRLFSVKNMEPAPMSGFYEFQRDLKHEESLVTLPIQVDSGQLHCFIQIVLLVHNNFLSLCSSLVLLSCLICLPDN